MGQSSSFVVRGNLLWGEDLEVLTDSGLYIRDGRIASLLSDTEIDDVPDPVYDFGNCFVLPGLIDTHCHLTLPGDGRDVDRFLQDSADEVLVATGMNNAYRALNAGITTLRDLGSRGRSGFAVQRQLATSNEPAPRVLVSGPVLTPVRGHGWTFGMEISAIAAAQEAVHRLHDAGASVIKLMASGGSTPGTETWRASMPIDMFLAIVEAAHAVGLPVAAHVSCPEAAHRCVKAGVDDIEHLNFWSDPDYTNHVDRDLLDRIRNADIFVGPTLQTSYHVLHETSDTYDPRATIRRKLYADVLENFRLLAETNQRIIAGSDAGFLVTRFDELHLGLRIMTENGLSHVDALRSATVRAAKALHLWNETGCLRPGLAADLLVVRGNPLFHIDALQDVRAVFVKGRSVRVEE